ncbi:MAG: D-alanyl-D-alanine carboxypeptidase [Actinobacteria bacterium]|nr:D-alanyl-D-alanine carboxypeptidase [Actinomycetota bacterium]
MRGRRSAIRRTAAALGGLLLFLVLLPALAGAQSVGTPPPTPVPPAGSLSPFPSVLRTPSPSGRPPEIRAGSAVLADLDTGQVLFARNPDQRRPIASLTKIMTALLVLQNTRGTDVVTVSEQAAAPQHAAGLSVLGLRAAEQLPVSELMYALLLQSANDAAVALAEHVGGTVEGFVRLMNEKAAALGMRATTRFSSPNGLDDRGYSTAQDLLTMTRAGYRFPRFAQIVATQFHDIPSPDGEPRRIQNRNVLLWLYPGAVGVKTGFTSAAGYNVIAAAERDGRRLVAVVLGEPGEPFSDAAALLDYGFEGFERRTLIEAGESFGTVPIDGHRVTVVAKGGLAKLVPVEGMPDLVRAVSVDEGVAFPPAVGERVGEVRVSVPGFHLGRVPLVVSLVPPPPPPPPGPWWLRAMSAVTHAVGGILDALLG